VARKEAREYGGKDDTRDIVGGVSQGRTIGRTVTANLLAFYVGHGGR